MSGQAEQPQDKITPSFDFIEQGHDRELVLEKRGQRYVFRCNAGEESELLQQLVQQAKDPASDIDWFDAAVLSHQMGQKFNQQMSQLLKSLPAKAG